MKILVVVLSRIKICAGRISVATVMPVVVSDRFLRLLGFLFRIRDKDGTDANVMSCDPRAPILMYLPYEG